MPATIQGRSAASRVCPAARKRTCPNMYMIIPSLFHASNKNMTIYWTSSFKGKGPICTLRCFFTYIKKQKTLSVRIGLKKSPGIRGSVRIRSSVLQIHTKTSKSIQIHSVVSENLSFCHGTFNKPHHFCSKFIDFLSKIPP